MLRGGQSSPRTPGTAGDIDYRILLLFAGAALVVSVVVARWAAERDASTVRRWFAVVVLAVAVFVATAAVINPSVVG